MAPADPSHTTQSWLKRLEALAAELEVSAEHIEDFVAATVLACDPRHAEARPLLDRFFARIKTNPQAPDFAEALQAYFDANPIAPLLKALLTEHLTELLTELDGERIDNARRRLGRRQALPGSGPLAPVENRGALGFFSAKKILGLD